jgi:chromosome segregation ATPase
MGDDRVGAASVGKSVRSLLEALRSLEREIEVVFERATEGPANGVRRAAARFVRGTFSASSVDVAALLRAGGVLSAEGFGTKAIARFLGLADDAALEEVKAQVGDLLDQVARLREREVALAGGLSQLRARAARFDEALAGLARVQGRCAARLRTQDSRSDRVETLAGRRDDHITRLIRDTAAQRAEMERLVRDIEDERRKRAAELRETTVAAPAVDNRIQTVERQFDDLKRAQKTGTQSVIDSLESLRDRIGKLEARAAEMSREARAKTGRIDALTRHVAVVESRLSSAMGQRASSSIPTAIDRDDTPVTATGTT